MVKRGRPGYGGREGSATGWRYLGNIEVDKEKESEK